MPFQSKEQQRFQHAQVTGLSVTVAKRVMPMDNKASYWTWTLYQFGPRPLARAEYCWRTAASARRDARKFLKLIGRPEVKIKTAARTLGDLEGRR